MDYSFLYGKWHIAFSNFPMWLKGDRTSPTLNYSPGQKPQVVSDVVEYMQHGQIRRIKGIDYSPQGNLELIWRGRGLLRILKSRWRIEYLSDSKEWMILSFERTLFTPAGHDVVAKEEFDYKNQSKFMLAKFNELFPNTSIYPLPSKLNHLHDQPKPESH